MTNIFFEFVFCVDYSVSDNFPMSDFQNRLARPSVAEASHLFTGMSMGFNLNLSMSSASSPSLSPMAAPATPSSSASRALSDELQDPPALLIAKFVKSAMDTLEQSVVAPLNQEIQRLQILSRQVRALKLKAAKPSSPIVDRTASAIRRRYTVTSQNELPRR
jgi:hypothetical protein